MDTELVSGKNKHYENLKCKITITGIVCIPGLVSNKVVGKERIEPPDGWRLSCSYPALHGMEWLYLFSFHYLLVCFVDFGFIFFNEKVKNISSLSII